MWQWDPIAAPPPLSPSLDLQTKQTMTVPAGYVVLEQSRQGGPAAHPATGLN